MADIASLRTTWYGRPIHPYEPRARYLYDIRFEPERCITDHCIRLAHWCYLTLHGTTLYYCNRHVERAGNPKYAS